MGRRPFFGSSGAPQIAKMDMRAATDPGRAFGQMFASLGKTAADSLEKYRENKRRSEEEEVTTTSISGFLKSNPELAKQYFDADDEKEIDIVAKGLAKNENLPKIFSSLTSLDANMRARQEAVENQAAVERFSQRAMGMIPNPKVQEIEGKIASERSQLNNLLNTPEVSESGIPRPKNQRLIEAFETRIGKLQSEADELQSQIPMMSADVNTFLENYGQPQSPQEAQLLQQEIVRRQARDDAMVGKNFTTAVQQMQLGQGMQKQMGDQFVSNYRSQTPYYFSEAEARQNINAAASQSGVSLTKEQMDQVASRARIIDTKEVSSAKRNLMKDDRLLDADTIIESFRFMEEFLKPNAEGKYNAVKDTAAVDKLARMIQPTGILTEPDIQRVSGSQAFKDRYDRSVKKLLDGTLDDKSRADLLEAGRMFARKAAQVKREGVAKATSDLSRQFDVDEDVMQERFFSNDLQNTRGLEGPLTSSPSNNKGSSRIVTLPDGTQAEGVVRDVLPNGTLIIEANGMLLEADPIE
jgi:hypothetical protein